MKIILLAGFCQQFIHVMRGADPPLTASLYVFLSKYYITQSVCTFALLHIDKLARKVTQMLQSTISVQLDAVLPVTHALLNVR